MSAIKLGLFFQPFHFPERVPVDCWDEDVDTIVLGDKLGYSEAWLGEHYCIRWENLPAPELIIAKALGLTSQIRLGTGVHVLSYHHPAVIAHKVAALDQLARGRFLFGIGAGGSPADFEMLGIDARNNEHRERMVESLDMILQLWASEGEMRLNGKFWNLKIPFPNKKMSWQYYHRPHQQPHPPIAVAGTSPYSDTLGWGAERGFIPLSIDANVEIIRSHWMAIQRGATRGGKAVSRADWRIARVVYVAETDEIAREHVLESSIARGFKEYFLRVYRFLGGLDVLKHDPSVADSELDAAYAMEHLWMVGSVETVTRKLSAFYNDIGGFGTLLVLHFDTHPYPERYHNSLRLLKQEVLPQLETLTPLADTDLLPSSLREKNTAPAT